MFRVYTESMETATVEPRLGTDTAQEKREDPLFITHGVTDEVAAAAYLLMKRQGLLSTVFYESDCTLKHFMEWNTSPRNEVIGCYVRKDGDQADLAGMGWIDTKTKVGNGFKYECSFMFFREFQNTTMPLRFARMMVDFCFEHLGAILLCGTTPVANLPAMRFIKPAGFSVLGIMPSFCTWQGEPCGAALSYLTREMWEKHGRG